MAQPTFRRFNSSSGDARIIVITTGGTIVQQFDKDSGFNFLFFNLYSKYSSSRLLIAPMNYTV